MGNGFENLNRPLLVGNWKMHCRRDWRETIDAIDILASAKPSIEVGLCLPATIIERAAVCCRSLAIGGQDCHSSTDGAFTGGISADMIREAGGTLVIIGHSETRAKMQKPEFEVAAKVDAAWKAGLRVVLCVGESAMERTSGEAIEATASQLFNSLPRTIGGDLVLAYEPIWAIGSEDAAPLDHVYKVISNLRSLAIQAVENPVRIIYGGAVSARTTSIFVRETHADGFLVGRASRNKEEFSKVMDLFK